MGVIPPYAKEVSKITTVKPQSIIGEAFTPDALPSYVTVTEVGKFAQEHSVTDNRMGASVYNPRRPCEVCRLDKCVGHCGHIPLPKVCLVAIPEAIKFFVKKMCEICYNCKGVAADCRSNAMAKRKGKPYDLSLCTEKPPIFRKIKLKRKGQTRFCLVTETSSVLMTHREVRDFLLDVPSTTWEAIDSVNFVDNFLNDIFFVAPKPSRPSAVRADQMGRESKWYDPETLLTEHLVKAVRSVFELRQGLYKDYFHEEEFSDVCIRETEPDKKFDIASRFEDKAEAKQAKKERR